MMASKQTVQTTQPELSNSATGKTPVRRIVTTLILENPTLELFTDTEPAKQQVTKGAGGVVRECSVFKSPKDNHCLQPPRFRRLQHPYPCYLPPVVTPTLPQTSPWSIARRTKLQPEKLHSMTRKVTKYIVKDMAPLTTISSPHFREMLDEFDNRWKAPNRDTLANTLIPSWYDEEKSKLILCSMTSDGWTSVATDHFLTFTAHFIVDWKLLSRVLRTKAVFVPQTGENVAVEIEDCLADFGLKDKVSMITVDNAANMEVAAEKAGIMKLGCFAHTLNLAAQKAVDNPEVNKHGKVVLREKQKLLGLPDHLLILDVKTRWNSTHDMMVRFLEQYPALLSACRDERIRKSPESERLDKISDEDIGKAEEFCAVMKILLSCTVAMSKEKQPTAGLIIPILKKLEKWMTIKPNDSRFTKEIKSSVSSSLAKRYQEAAALDPRFKGTVTHDDAVWERLAALQNKKSGLAELFEEEDEVLITHVEAPESDHMRAFKEVEDYRATRGITSDMDPLIFWQTNQFRFPMLCLLATKFLCVQGSSVPSKIRDDDPNFQLIPYMPLSSSPRWENGERAVSWMTGQLQGKRR
ncbi:hypothetical protein F7725_021793, partial [Dissostichus mawsoni]